MLMTWGMASIFNYLFSILFRITLQDCEVLYLKDRPEKLIVTDIAVPPVAVRPSVFMDLKSR